MQRRWFLLKSILIAAVSVAGLSAVQAQDEEKKTVDPSGSWTWDRPGQGGESVKTTLTLEFKDGKLTGTMASDEGELEISEGEVDGNVVAFEVIMERQGLEIPLYFEGKVEGDSIDGFIEVEFAGNVREFPWKPTRGGAAAADGASGIAGTWAMHIETEDGQIFEPTMVIAKGDDGYTGTFTSQLGEAGVEDIKEEDGKAMFTVNLDLGDGQALVSKYTGNLDGDSIEGTLEFDFAGQTGTATFSGKRETPVDLSGTWAMHIETEDGQIFEPTMVIASGDDGYTGTFTSQLGEAGVEDIKIEDGNALFTVKLDLGDGQALVSKYTGKLDGDAMEGTLEFDFAGQAGSATFSGKREAAGADISGTWGLYLETEDGQIFEPSMVIASGDDGYTGSFNSDLGEADLEDVKLEDDTVTFTISLDFDGQALVSKYEGKLDGDTIEGTFEFDLAGQAGTGTFKATREAAEE